MSLTHKEKSLIKKAEVLNIKLPDNIQELPYIELERELSKVQSQVNNLIMNNYQLDKIFFEAKIHLAFYVSLIRSLYWNGKLQDSDYEDQLRFVINGHLDPDNFFEKFANLNEVNKQFGDNFYHIESMFNRATETCILYHQCFYETFNVALSESYQFFLEAEDSDNETNLKIEFSESVLTEPNLSIRSKMTKFLNSLQFSSINFKK